MRHGKGVARRYHSGFTVFEMVVTICSIVILYMVAEERLNQLPAAAERANFFAILEQIKTGVSFEMITKLAAGRGQEIRELENTNPMAFLIEPPSNYRGELEFVTDAVERRNSWYFETSTGQLVYVIGGASIDDVVINLAGINVYLGQIRLKLTNVYSGEENGGDSGISEGQGGGDWEALVLAPVYGYSWERLPEQPVPVN